MTDSAQTVPGLRVETTAVDDMGMLIPLLDPQQPLLWLRNEQGLIGVGTALRLEFSGESRIAEASAIWRTIAAAAKVVDPLKSPGTGLVAFGAFTFSAHSAGSSVLIVPELILGKRNGVHWMTRITVAREFESEPSEHPTLRPAQPLGKKPQISFQPGAATPESYRDAVTAAVGRIRRGDLEKVVLARDLVGHIPRNTELRHPLIRLARDYPDCWTFAVDGLLGASPETLVQVDDRTVHARVLAGTISRGHNAAADQAAAHTLITSVKDLNEHRFAVESVLSALAPHSLTLSTSENPFALKLPNLWHLASDINGTLSDGSTSIDLAAALHPTAAVAGTPRADALQFIEQLEPFDRGRYAGPVGWVGADGDGEWAIALRCAQIDANEGLTAYAGAGIVAASDPESELIETDLKFRPIVEAFG